MLSRSALRSSRSAYACVQCAQRRTYAAASGNFNYNVAEAAGTRLVSRDTPGSTSTLALVAKAGTRYQWVPGLTETLQNFAFKNTDKRFAVRIVRETELLGSEFFSKSGREAIVYGAKFFKEDLPYFVELFSEIAAETKYQEYIIDEVIQPSINHAHAKYLSNPVAVALNNAHAVAFQRGLGNQNYPDGLAHAPRVLAPEVEAYAAAAYAKNNIALVGTGVDQGELSKWAGEFFKAVPASAPSGLPSIETKETKYFGGQQRLASDKGAAITIAFPGTSIATGNSYKPEIEVLAPLLGGQSSIKWAQGTAPLAKVAAAHPGVQISTEISKYSDAGLIHVTISGSNKAVAAAAKAAADAIKSTAQSPSTEDVKKAIAQARFKAYELETGSAPPLDLVGLNAITSGSVQAPEDLLKGLANVSESAVSEAAKKLIDGKVSYVAVGDLSQLPYAEELGFNV